MYYTEELLRQRIAELQAEKVRLEEIVWCKTFECNEYSHGTIKQLSIYLQDVDRMLISLRAILIEQYGVEL